VPSSWKVRGRVLLGPAKVGMYLDATATYLDLCQLGDTLEVGFEVYFTCSFKFLEVPSPGASTCLDIVGSESVPGS
jgi:hypothetical protein